MHAEVIVVTMKSWESHVESNTSGAHIASQESYTSAQRRMSAHLSEMKETTEREGGPRMVDGMQRSINSSTQC
uniref:Uncharacterized protein n=1 Tax=Aegilops tauschii subsp. strangulata TaxID=200361 RepID=A0A453MV88_AEGTS